MDESPSEHRSKRQKIDKHGRFAALQRLRDLKGSKNKYEVSNQVDNVFDTVDENEYRKRALARADEDWIDDDGTGYVEDGRDIFDDEDEYDNDTQSTTNGKGSKPTNNASKKRKLRDINAPVKGKSSIKSLFNNVVPKKKETNVKLAEDDILSGILDELDTSKPTTSSNSTSKEQHENGKSNNDEALIVQNYLQKFTRNVRKSVKRQQEDNDDDEILDRILKPPVVKKTTNSSQTIQSKKIAVPEKVTPSTSKILQPAAQCAPENDENLEFKCDDFAVDFEHETKDGNNEKSKLPVAVINDEQNEMDFSMLDDDENQFETEKIVSNAVATVCKQQPQVDSANFEEIFSNWENIENCNDDFMTVTIGDDIDLKNETETKFWFWDAYEDQIRRPGQLFLFGKIAVEGKSNEYKSVCVHVENVDRLLYLLPREYVYDVAKKANTKTEVSIKDVYEEFNQSFPHDFRSKKSTKNFAFTVPNVDVPLSCDYLEIRYAGKHPPPNTRKTYKTYSHIFGANTPALETFLMETKIKGPCWLNLTNYKLREKPFSWCKLELVCSTVKSISVAVEKNPQPPPLVIATINVRTAFNPKTTRNEIVMIACLVNNNFYLQKKPPTVPFHQHFCGFTRPIGQNWPNDIAQKLATFKATKTTKHENERALLSWFLTSYRNIDPDLIVTHDIYDCQLDVICDRIAAIKIPQWSRLGRLNMSQITNKRPKDVFIGRLICDVKHSAEELIKSKSFDLNTLCQNVLKIKDGERIDVSNDQLHAMYETGEGIIRLITLTMQDCSFIIRLMCDLNILPLSLQITNICGCLFSESLLGGRSQRNESLLLHAFTEKNYIVPDKKLHDGNWRQENDLAINGGDSLATAATTTVRKKAQYTGGMVFDPIIGFYDKYILLMDFNSLYPSIIQEYNICFTTVFETIGDDGEMPSLPDSTLETGVLPNQIRRLVESRREVKKLMLNSDLEPELRTQYDIRQKALKLTANSMYGCLGYSKSRFCAQHLAALVTHMGREILQNTKNLVQKMNYPVIYGDTDSIMVNTNSIDYEQVYKIGYEIKKAVNKLYRQVELDIDGVFKSLLLLKKKKYSAMTINKTKKGELLYSREDKGLDIVRRDWSQIAKMAGEIVLEEIFSDVPLDERIANIHTHLEKFGQTITDGSTPHSLLTITRQLTKAPKEYTKTLSLPHVQVALRMNSTRNKRYKKGDMVDYIICNDGTDNVPMQRAYHLDELKTMKNLSVDTNYYLANQIHPVVFRLCEPIEGTSGSRIAECLGLDPNKFKASTLKIQRDRNDDAVGESIVKSSTEKFRNCEKFKFKCVACKEENLMAAAFKRNESQMIPVLDKCSNVECTVPPHQYIDSIKNQLIMEMRKFIGRFYENWLVCDEPICNYNTRTYTHVTINGQAICFACKQGTLIRQYTETDLNNQLSYFGFIFDLSQYPHAQSKITPKTASAYSQIKQIVDQQLEKSDFRIIRLGKLFERMPTNYDRMKNNEE